MPASRGTAGVVFLGATLPVGKSVLCRGDGGPEHGARRVGLPLAGEAAGHALLGLCHGDETVPFASALVLTLVEFIACLTVYHSCRSDDLASRTRLVLTVVAVSCMVGKMSLAVVAIFPLKKDWARVAVRERGGGAPSRDWARDYVVTDESESQMTRMEEAKVQDEDGIVLSEETYVCRYGAVDRVVRDQSKAGSEMAGMDEAKIQDEDEDGVAPTE